MPETKVVVPELDHDAMMLAKYGSPVSARGRLERRIVAEMIAHLDAAGFVPWRTYDGDCFEKCSDAKSAMEFIFNLDEVSLRFVPKGVERRRGDVEHGVLIVLGNGPDCICDWNYSRDDADGFNKAMEAFQGDDWYERYGN